MATTQNDLLVIGAGLMRTGTNSLQLALQRLLGGKCYHMVSVTENFKQADFWLKAASKNPSKEEWRAFLADYKAAVDFPPVAFYKELMEVYPNAKVVLTVRDPERWFASVNTTIRPTIVAMAKFPMNLIVYLSGMSKFLQMIKAVTEKVMGETDEMTNKELMIAAYHRHVEEVKRLVPAERLLIFEAREGWKPLCDFLGVSVPDEDYPHVNTAGEFIARVDKIQRFRTLSVLCVGLLVAGVVYMAWGTIRGGNFKLPFELPSFRATNEL